MCKISPTKDWNMDRETQSRILFAIQTLSNQFYNAFRSKKDEALDAPEQFIPEYIKKLKDVAEEENKKKTHRTKEELEETANFWKKHNFNAKTIEEIQ